MKTLEVEWGLSRMSFAILIAVMPALAAATGMALAYSDAVVASLGPGGAGWLVAGALFVVLLPVGAFLSYLMRFVFVNQHTLPSAGFTLGPELPQTTAEAPGSTARDARPGSRRPAT